MKKSKLVELFKQGESLVFCGSKVVVKNADYSWQEPEIWVQHKNGSGYQLNGAEINRVRVNNTGPIESLANLFTAGQWEKDGRPENMFIEADEGSTRLNADALSIQGEYVSEIKSYFNKHEGDTLCAAKFTWMKLGDVPVNEDGEIEEHFLNFEPDTDREAIWQWFESYFDVSVAEDLMFA